MFAQSEKIGGSSHTHQGRRPARIASITASVMMLKRIENCQGRSESIDQECHERRRQQSGNPDEPRLPADEQSVQCDGYGVCDDRGKTQIPTSPNARNIPKTRISKSQL